MKTEIEKVIELTGATKGQIKLHDDGFQSRAYIINNGEIVCKFPRKSTVKYDREIERVNYLNSLNLPISLQSVRLASDKDEFVVYNGVVGQSLEKIKNLDGPLKQDIGKKIGTFLKKLHSVKCDKFGKYTLDEEIEEWQQRFEETKEFFAKHFTSEEMESLADFMYKIMPHTLKQLGEKYVFSHADLNAGNIIVNDKNEVGIIDCTWVSVFDEAVDFMSLEDEPLITKAMLDYYGADEVLRKKVAIRNDVRPIILVKPFIKARGEESVAKEYVPKIKQVILKSNEIKKVVELTGVRESQIEFHDGGFQSRAYVVDNGRIVFKFQKKLTCSFQDETRTLNFLNEACPDLDVNLQKVGWHDECYSYLGIYGVVGKPLDNIILNDKQKKDVGKQLGKFLNRLHSINDHNFTVLTLKDEVEEWQKKYKSIKSFIKQEFSSKEQIQLEMLVMEHAPKVLKELGEDLVLSHGDLGEWNILIDKKGKIGIIDFSARYAERGSEFMDIQDENICTAMLNEYDADDLLRRKVEFRRNIWPVLALPSCIKNNQIAFVEKLVNKIKALLKT